MSYDNNIAHAIAHGLATLGEEMAKQSSVRREPDGTEMYLTPQTRFNRLLRKFEHRLPPDLSKEKRDGLIAAERARLSRISLAP